MLPGIIEVKSFSLEALDSITLTNDFKNLRRIAIALSETPKTDCHTLRNIMSQCNNDFEDFFSVPT